MIKICRGEVELLQNNLVLEWWSQGDVQIDLGLHFNQWC